MKSIGFIEKIKFKYEQMSYGKGLNFCFWGNNISEFIGLNFEIDQFERNIKPTQSSINDFVDVICIAGPINQFQIKELVKFIARQDHIITIVLLKRDIDTLVIGDDWYHNLIEQVSVDIEIVQNKISLSEVFQKIYDVRYGLVK